VSAEVASTEVTSTEVTGTQVVGAAKPGAAIRIPADHPCLPGHFPGHPLVPGALLLDAVVHAIEAALPGQRVAGFATVKFLAAVLPGHEVETRCVAPADGRVAFTCLRDGAVALRGTALLRPTRLPRPEP
jgi:3-hydroxyacyl-[acyl-carrier-protein] dehydratase